MAIARKPKAADPLALIRKGGAAAGEGAGGAQAQIALRLPKDLLARVETARRRGPVPLPRNTWILQAIAEKLEREGG